MWNFIKFKNKIYLYILIIELLILKNNKYFVIDLNFYSYFFKLYYLILEKEDYEEGDYEKAELY